MNRTAFSNVRVFHSFYRLLDCSLKVHSIRLGYEISASDD